jgi:signal peptide peptidase SppA
LELAGFFKRLLPKRFRKQGITIPVVRLHGAIMAGGSAFRPMLNIAAVGPLLERAFADKEAPAVAIAINSPGGSPVQSRLIYQRIRDLAEEKNKRVIVFVEDVAASGGYMIALAGDEIIADPTSIVGSIGVVSGGFGFTELLQKVGVERRVYTAGENKVMLDPFQPEKEKDVAYLKSLQQEIHGVFTAMVKARRGHLLTDDGEIFSGLFWTGERARTLGLIDGVGNMRGELKRRYGEKTELRLVSGGRGLLGRRQPGVAASAGALGVLGQGLAGGIAHSAVAGLAEAAEEKALWARFGL